VAQQPSLKLTAPVLDAPDPRALAEFYGRLLGWTIGTDEPDWVTLRAPEGVRGLSFQLEEAYVRPTWPAGPGDQQMQVHLDIESVQHLRGRCGQAGSGWAGRGRGGSTGRGAGRGGCWSPAGRRLGRGHSRWRRAGGGFGSRGTLGRGARGLAGARA
jgi:hypothetical protein